VMDLVQGTFKVTDEALQGARMTVNDVDAVILVGGPTRLPIVCNSVKHYFQKELMEGVDPDQVVSVGAALQAHALLDKATETFLVDVTPLSLRIGTVGGFSEKILEKNTPIPIEKSKTFTTSRDGQDKVKLRVYQGESNRAEENELLGEFGFGGFRIGYRGEVKIDVTFEIDSNGIVNVQATDQETGEKTSTTISLSSGLSETDIQNSMQSNRDTQLASRDGPSPGRADQAAWPDSFKCRPASMPASISASHRPDDRLIVVDARCPVSTSVAETLTIPLVSISKVTSILTWPRRAMRNPENSNSPSISHSSVLFDSPW
jgi:molecular chaperone DnaK